MKIQDILRQRVLILDGGIGTEILRRTQKTWDCLERLNLEQPHALTAIHQAYIEAGADILTTNTFGASRIKLKEFRLGSRTQEINAAAVQAAGKARGSRDVLIAGSIGPTGRLLKPLGDLDSAGAYAAFAEQARALAEAGADLLLIETQIDVLEAKIAVRAAREHSALPLAVSFSFPLEEGRTVTGSDPEAAAVAVCSMDVDVLGVNCGGHPRDLETVIPKMIRHTDKPLLAYANAGAPTKKDGQAIYPLDPETYAKLAVQFYNLGANVIGGCCGTTPAHIRLVASRLKGRVPAARKREPGLFRASSRSEVFMAGRGLPFRVVGENINPFGRKALDRDLRSRKLGLVRSLAREQEKAGADALDVNCGQQGEQSPGFYASTVRELQSVTALPLFLDNNNPKSLDRALAEYAGKAVLNSVNGKKESYEALFPLARRHGASLVLLAMDSGGIPETAEGRVRIIERLLQKALRHGISAEDLLADPIMLTIATSQRQAAETLKAIRMIEDLGLPTILGLSNISFGLPQRRLLNQAFLTLAVEKGLNAAILNPLDRHLMALARAAEAVTGKDRDLRVFLDAFGTKAEIAVEERREKKEISTEKALFEAVVEGEAETAKDLTGRLLCQGMTGFTIIDKILSPALKTAGARYETRKCFLPQLIRSAQAMEAASGRLKETLNVKRTSLKRLTVVMATVEGDLHDIGKNIVSLVLRNSGFRVIDLGKNVRAEKIIHTAVKEKADIIGLSALMTTTMDTMKNVLRLKREASPGIKVIVGGAAVTPAYARAIGADAYGKDAMDALKKIEKISGPKR